MEANTYENSNFRMPNYVPTFKGRNTNELTLWKNNVHIIFCADFDIKKFFQRPRPDWSRYQFFERFTLKVCCMEKSKQSLGENPPLSKYAVRRTQFFG